MDIRTELSQGKPLLFDGAMGTYYTSLPGRAEAPCELASLSHPGEITAIHEAYLKAGCQAIKTNTFAVGAHLASGKEDLAVHLTEAACRLALEAAAPYGACVFADLGPAPAGTRLTPADTYRRQTDLFLAQGLTHFLVETLPTDEGIPEFARYLKAHCPEAFLIVSFAVGFDGVTRDGLRGRELIQRTAALPEVDAVGFNCMSGPRHLLECIRDLDLNGKPLSVMPNAGYPTVLGRRVVYQGQPAYFAMQMAQIVRAGASIVGGCCGTTPDHIAKVADMLSRPLPEPVPIQPKAAARRSIPPNTNSLWDKLESGQRVIAVELDPPVDDHVEFFLEGVQQLRDAGADAVTIADCPIGRPRADSSLLACKIRRELGVEPLPHMTCRDRNLNATKALLLAMSLR